jgi:hypothetical protein
MITPLHTVTLTEDHMNPFRTCEHCPDEYNCRSTLWYLNINQDTVKGLFWLEHVDDKSVDDWGQYVEKVLDLQEKYKHLHMQNPYSRLGDAVRLSMTSPKLT